MIKKLRQLFLLFFISCSINAYSQEGTPLITNFSFGESSIDNESWAMTQDVDGQMLFANRRGIVTFDGMNWNTINTPSVPLSLYFDPTSSKVFVGCKNNIGMLQKEKSGIYKYISLNKEVESLGNIEQMTSVNEYVYFYSSSCVTRFSTKTKEIKKWAASIGEPYTGFIVNIDKIYVNIDKLGLHLLQENSIKPIQGGAKFNANKILFYFRYNRVQTLIGADNDSIYLFNGTSIAPYFSEYFESNKYIKENILAGGIDIDQNSFALSTLTGGCVIIDKNTHTSTYTINYQTGLPDDEVFSLGVDRNKGLWVLHEYGMSRVDLNLPVRNINNYPGLEGNLTSLIGIDTVIYVSTSKGVYYLTEVKNYDDIEVLINAKEKAANKKDDELERDKNSIINDDENKTGIFGKLFGKNKDKKKNKRTNEATEEESLTETIVVEKEKKESNKKVTKKNSSALNNPISKYETKKNYVLKSISHRFIKIVGVEGKTKQLVQYGNKLLVASNTGLYQIENFRTTQIISDKYVHYICQAKMNNHKFYIGTSDGLLIAENQKGKWIIKDVLDDFNVNVYSILELHGNNLWIGSENVAYNILFDKSDNPVNIKSYPIKSNFTERILVRNVFGIPYFFLSTGLHSYNAEKDSILFNKKTNKGFIGQSKYIFSQDNITWVFNENKWTNLYEKSKYASLPKEFLELFGNVSNIYVDDKSNLWVIDNNNSIYKIINTQKDYEEIFDVYLKFINGKQGELLPLSNLVLSYDNSSLSFNVSAPYFVRSNAITFKYKVEGLTSDWSDWRKDLAIDFPFIPDGKYTLLLKAKNILGKETTIHTYSFKITPPYWKRWWFYFFCVLGLSGLVWLIIRARLKQLTMQRKLLEDKIAIRTAQLVKEKEKTEELLLNILPKETAAELKKFGKAKARHYDYASVMFTDFKGFTFLAEKLIATDLVKEIDYCFANFDDIIEKYRIEKIKTIGDSYMCAAGIPVEDSFNPILITLAGLEIVNFMEKHIKEKKKTDSPYFELRVGIHTGPLVTGVVGKKKFAYDIWGDTVNTASRLESSGEVGMINVSEVTYKIIKDYFDCEFRGNIEAKNKGKFAMYFVKRIKAKYAEDAAGKIPNAEFRKRINL